MQYPDDTSTKGDQANCRRSCKKLNLVSGQMMLKGNRLVIIDKQRLDAYQSLGDNAKVVGLS